MRKKHLATCVTCTAVCTAVSLFCGCFKGVDYLEYVSEKRSGIYLYQDDGISVKIHCSQKEQPYAADGIKGDMCGVAEIFVTLPKTYEEVKVSVENCGGEMNWQSVEKQYYLSFSAEPFTADSVEVTLTYDGTENTYSALSVKDKGVMSCDDAVKCVIEHDKKLFESLTSNRVFNGEIYVRLLYDEGCYYYVGVCDRSGHTTAYLIDGEHGKIIATKELQR